MKPSDYLLDIGNPVAYYPGLVKHLGSVNAVLFFSQIFYWQDKAASELGVYKTVEEIEAETGMTYREQATARKQLAERGVLVETNKRFEHRIYYRIDVDRLNGILQFANCGKRISGDAESAVRGVRIPQVVNKTEITTEITTPMSGMPDYVAEDSGEGDDREPELLLEASDPVAEIIDYLNECAGTRFRVVEASAKLIRARMREGATIGQLRAVVSAKAIEWPKGDRMRKYLRPATLFNAEKFEQYLGQLPMMDSDGEVPRRKRELAF